MNVKEIPNLDEIFTSKKIISYTIERLTAPGENYGSLILSLDLEIESTDNDDDGSKTLQTVAKLPPPNPVLWHLFNTKITFRNEVNFYKITVPALREFYKLQRNNSIKTAFEFVPGFHGGRLTLSKTNNEVDKNALLVLENLKASNFQNGPRKIGLDLRHARVVLADLAHFHAIPLAVKWKRPEMFKENIAIVLEKHDVKKSRGEDVYKQTVECLIAIVRGVMNDKYRERYESLLKIEPSVEAREPFATIMHNDLWVNNIMQKDVEETGEIHNRFVDYQSLGYGSFARDLMFFLYTSIEDELVLMHYDALLKHYYDTFVGVLSELDCGVEAERFTESVFEEEIAREATNLFFTLTYMVQVIFADKGTVKELDELTADDLLPTTDVGSLNQRQRQKYRFLIEEFVRRKFI